ncbi:MAG: ubiquinone/menaquinone biosynthesis methyltransferase [Candidatus Omnitrophica bacterium]|nr:ubiquinone/menaquinone biosynthesis methyltransferase [Candidatus Omnitrophota bacterium]
MEEISSGDIRRFFSLIAPKYDFFNNLLSAKRQEAWKRRLVQCAFAAEKGRVLDLCTGTADLAVLFASNRGYKRITAVDFSDAMLRQARQKIEKYGLKGRIDLVQADALKLPFSPGSFNVVAVAFGLRNLVDRRRAMEEIRRVLAPRGKLAILEFCNPRASFASRLILVYLSYIAPFIIRIFSGKAGIYKYLVSSINDFFTPGELVDLLDSAGFAKPYSQRIDFGIAHMFVAEKI